MRHYDELTSKLLDWLKEKITGAGACGGIVGLSGGLDSSVTAVLLVQAFPENTLGVILPCGSSRKDTEYAHLVAERFAIPTVELELDAIYSLLSEKVADLLPENGRFPGERSGEEEKRLAFANIKPRLRMTVLYTLAQLRNLLVVGTDNRSELHIGYFTKYGDGGVDLCPLGNLVKTEVRGLARHLGVPGEIIDRKPSAGLWEGQTDEEELGISYRELDRYLLSGEGSREVQEQIRNLHEKSQHKRAMPPCPDF